MPAARRAQRVFIGTSGYSYTAWRGSFYPDGMPAREMLAFYARALDTVEINHTFHRLPTAELLRSWADQVPAGFRFALKAPQRITHHLRLRDAGEVTGAFCAVASTLKTKLGPLLFQLPPYLRCDHARLDEFLGTLPAGVEAAVEFRHDSWFNEETYAVLRQHRAALCIADAEGLSTPPIVTASFGYLRLRRQDYTEDEVATWAARMRDTVGWKRAYVYFKHEDSGRGPELARILRTRLGGPSQVARI